MLVLEAKEQITGKIKENNSKGRNHSVLSLEWTPLASLLQSGEQSLCPDSSSGRWPIEPHESAEDIAFI